MSGCLSISWGRNGGLYTYRRHGVWRICLWRVALTYIDQEWEDIVR